MKTIRFNSTLKISIVSLVLILLSACNGSGTYKEDLSLDAVDVSESFESIEAEETAKAIAIADLNNVDPPSDLKIIKSATARYKVKDVKVATEQIKAIANRFDAYVSDLRFENNLYQKQNRFTLKVPQQNFDVVMDSIGSVVEFVEYENITTKDVTEEYIDLQSRLETKLAVQARYEEILRKNARTVEEILNTEEKLRVLQEEIESAQGRLKYLTNKVAYSTIQVDLYETVEYKDEPSSYTKSFGDKSRNALAFGWDMIEAVLLFFIHIWPLWILGIIVAVVLKRKLKR